jgi:hypothetical protein
MIKSGRTDPLLLQSIEQRTVLMFLPVMKVDTQSQNKDD